ncbi:DNA alkylation repair protein [uncultured Clostridium sp.]|uniref:DNA alkylation repair protein n=1 Tax=uncultured Clostridium sp. TaxID=59620 RepID=UPI00261C7C34|nr:DNA alkylation repair protein [uncultured Clostridium sp.]
MDKDMVKLVKEEIAILRGSNVEEKSIKTGDIRKISSKIFKSISDKNIKNVLDICESLLEEHNWELGVIAYDWANRVHKQYTKETYDVFYSWLKKYIRGWGDCDDFCTHAFGQLLLKYKEIFSYILEWTEDEGFWVRRAAAVILIPAISKNDYNGIKPLEIADKLLKDEHDLVRKGYGWMLKILATVDEKTVVEYLEKNYKNMPRVAFRYALEKVDVEKRKYLMSLK